jgi:hypothetical protein
MGLNEMIGNVIADAFIALAVLAFGAGIVVSIAGWALWYFVLSHITFGWV